jgi:hypothetical protein
MLIELNHLEANWDKMIESKVRLILTIGGLTVSLGLKGACDFALKA